MLSVACDARRARRSDGCALAPPTARTPNDATATTSSAIRFHRFAICSSTVMRILRPRKRDLCENVTTCSQVSRRRNGGFVGRRRRCCATVSGRWPRRAADDQRRLERLDRPRRRPVAEPPQQELGRLRPISRVGWETAVIPGSTIAIQGRRRTRRARRPAGSRSPQPRAARARRARRACCSRRRSPSAARRASSAAIRSSASGAWNGDAQDQPLVDGDPELARARAGSPCSRPASLVQSVSATRRRDPAVAEVEQVRALPRARRARCRSRRRRRERRRAGGRPRRRRRRCSSEQRRGGPVGRGDDHARRPHGEERARARELLRLVAVVARRAPSGSRPRAASARCRRRGRA